MYGRTPSDFVPQSIAVQFVHKVVSLKHIAILKPSYKNSFTMVIKCHA